MYRRTTPATPPETILRLREIAEKYLDFVYTGNMPGEEDGSDTRVFRLPYHSDKLEDQEVLN